MKVRSIFYRGKRLKQSDFQKKLGKNIKICREVLSFVGGVALLATPIAIDFTAQCLENSIINPVEPTCIVEEAPDREEMTYVYVTKSGEVIFYDDPKVIEKIKESEEKQEMSFSIPVNFGQELIDTYMENEIAKKEEMVETVSIEDPIQETIENPIIEEPIYQETIKEEAPIDNIDLEIQKLDIIEANGWTQEQFDVVCAVALAESAPLSYDDAYGVISTMINRTRSAKWVHSVNLNFGEGAGFDVYYQTIQPNQFEVYFKGLYKDFLPGVFPGKRGGYEKYHSIEELPGYRGVLDALTSLEPNHNYLNFCASNGNKENKFQLVKNGNLYYNRLQEKDMVQNEQVKVSVKL